MPHSSLDDLPSATSRGWPSAEGHFRSAHWGDMEVSFTTVDGPLDCTELYKAGGYPGGVCQCPHYFYVFEGRIRCRWLLVVECHQLMGYRKQCQFQTR